MASLPDLQARFAAALRGDSGPIEPDVVGDGLEVSGRLGIYRNNARAVFEGAMERTYPVLRRRVGDAYFRQLAHGYRERFPSRSGDLHGTGEHFPGYLAEVEAGSGYEWLADLAALEWACESAFVAAREPSVEPQALARLTPDDLGQARLRLQPSLRCVASPFPVLDVWHANQPGADGRAVDLSSRGQCVLVSCGVDGLELVEVSSTALGFIRRLQAGTPLAAALDESGLELAELTGALGLLFSSGLVTGVSAPRMENGSP